MAQDYLDDTQKREGAQRMFSKGPRLPEQSGLPDSQVLAYAIIELVYLV